MWCENPVWINESQPSNSPARKKTSLTGMAMLNPPGGSTRRSSSCLAGKAHHDIKLTDQNMAESYAKLMQVLPSEIQM